MFDNIKLQNYLRERTDLSLQEKGLALILTTYRNSNTGRCFPSQMLLAKKNNTTRERVNRLIHSLKRKKVLAVKKLRAPDLRKRTVTNYVFLYDENGAE